VLFRSPLHILVVEDNALLARNLADGLDAQGYSADFAADGELALQLALDPHQHYDLAIIDIGLPGMDGLALCRRLRERQARRMPVLMLTAMEKEADRIVGVELGANDYLPKTCSRRELRARLGAVTRRGAAQAGDKAAAGDLVAGELTLNGEAHVARLRGEALDLTALEFAILASLLKAKGRVKTREALLEEVSARRFDVFDRSIDVHVSQLRRKLGDDARHPRFIRTIRGVGYKLEDSSAS